MVCRSLRPQGHLLHEAGSLGSQGLRCVALDDSQPPLVHAQEHIALPPVNLGGSSFMDGVGGPGLLVREGVGVYGAPRFIDASGEAVPGQNSVVAVASTTLVGYMPPFKVLGGNWGVELLAPVVYADLTTPSGSASTTGIGDLTFSALVWQAPPLVLGAGQLFQRLDLDVVAPTGQYASRALITAGSHSGSVNPYYAFTWLATDGIETSWRLQYLWNSVNNAPGPGYGGDQHSTRPGGPLQRRGVDRRRSRAPGRRGRLLPPSDHEQPSERPSGIGLGGAGRRIGARVSGASRSLAGGGECVRRVRGREPAAGHPCERRRHGGLVRVVRILEERDQRVVLSFPPFRLDVTEGRLWKSGRELRIRPKPFAILHYLTQHPRRLVTQSEIVAAVWEGWR